MLVQDAKLSPSVGAESEAIVNDAPRTFTDADFPVGSVAHQGDLILVRLAALPANAKRRRERQLAQGNTQGSRHVLKRGVPYDCEPAAVAGAVQSLCKGVSVAPEYIGPVFATSRGVADLVHPEHGDHFYRGDMVIGVVYQRNLDAEERERRALD
ncbi:MAG: hypothetical protein LLG00_14855 [Planctomycetaceae bacterium]|nr:hypothetical protein [Planctomycetaceae bacterium]